MPNYCWKIKALKRSGQIAPGMEVEVIVQGSRPPSNNEIRDVFALKYNIKPPFGGYGNKYVFEIIKP